MIYLDYAASTPIDPAVIECMTSSFLSDFANPSAAHKEGKRIKKKIDECTESILKNLNANDFSLIFTSSATESNNMIINHFDKLREGQIFSCAADHPSLTFERQEEGLLAWPFNQEIELPLVLNGSLFNLCIVNNLSGALLSLETLKEIRTKKPATHIHLDASQALGRVDLNPFLPFADSVTFSGHKIYGPKGVGLLLVRKGEKIAPLLKGGGHQEGMRSSTLAGPLIIGMAKAVELALDKLKENDERLTLINRRMRSFIKEVNSDAQIPLEISNSSPHILLLVFPGISSDILLRHLEQKEIMVSSSSACSSRVKGDKSTLTAMGLDKELHKNVLRISFSYYTTDAEVEIFEKEFRDIWKKVSAFIRK